MNDLFTKLYENEKNVMIDTFEDIDVPKEMTKISDFSGIEDVYAQIKKHLDEMEREIFGEVLNALDKYRTVFLEGYPDIIMQEFEKRGYTIFSFERRGGFQITDRNVDNGINPGEAMFKIPQILKEKKSGVVVIENINYLADFWGVDGLMRFLNTLLFSKEYDFRYVFTGRMINAIMSFFEKKIGTNENVYLKPEGGIYVSERSPNTPHVRIRFENGNIYVENHVFPYGGIYEAYELLQSFRGDVIIEGFEKLEDFLGRESRLWLKAVMDLIYPNSVILLRYPQKYFVKGRIFMNLDDFKYLRYPVCFTNIHKINLKNLSVLEKIVDVGNNICMTYNSFDLVYSKDSAKMKKIRELAEKMQLIRL